MPLLEQRISSCLLILYPLRCRKDSEHRLIRPTVEGKRAEKQAEKNPLGSEVIFIRREMFWPLLLSSGSCHCICPQYWTSVAAWMEDNTAIITKGLVKDDKMYWCLSSLPPAHLFSWKLFEESWPPLYSVFTSKWSLSCKPLMCLCLQWKIDKWSNPDTHLHASAQSLLTNESRSLF